MSLRNSWFKNLKGYLTHHAMMFMFSHHVQIHLIFELLEFSDMEKIIEIMLFEMDSIINSRLSYNYLSEQCQSTNLFRLIQKNDLKLFINEFVFLDQRYLMFTFIENDGDHFPSAYDLELKCFFSKVLIDSKKLLCILL